MPSLLRVDMAAGRCCWEDLPTNLDGMGGRGVCSGVLARETPPDCDPSGPANKLIFSPGLLGATAALPHNRLAMGCKSPVTGKLKSALVRCLAANHLVRLGIAGIIIENQAPQGSALHLEIRQGRARLMPSPVAGLGIFAAMAGLEDLYGSECAYIAIGPAGEMRLPAANIALTGPKGVRHAGQGGMGAVMGGKGLKSVAVFPPLEEGRERPEAEREAFRKASDRLAAALAELSAKTRQSLAHAGGEDARETPGSSQGSGNPHLAGNGCFTACGLCGPSFAARRKKHREKSAAYNALWNLPQTDADNALRARFDFLCDDLGLDAFALSAAVNAAVEKGTMRQGEGGAVVEILERLGGNVPPSFLAGNALELFCPAAEKERPASDADRAATAFADAMGMCAFFARAVLKNREARTAVAELVRARFGRDVPEDYALSLGRRIVEMEEVLE